MNPPLPLRLRFRPAPTPIPATPAAFFLAGDDPRAWLEEILRWELDAAVEETLELLLLPRGPADRAPAGVLVVLPPGVTGGGERPGHPRAGRGVLYTARAGGRFFLPADAGLDPPVTEGELEALGRGFERLVFHPALGLTGFDAAEALRLPDLLTAPPVGTADWNAAHPGIPANHGRLLSVQLFAPTPTWEDLFGGASEEIGSEPADDPNAAEGGALPADPREASAGGPLNQLGRGLTRGFAAAAAGFAGAIPHLPGVPRSWVNDLEDWAQGKLERMAADLENVRHRELHRLMRLLEQDPEKGLRHAIPMNRLLHRGRTRPGGQLGARKTDFDLRRLVGGGQAADPWDVPARFQAELLARYRELAGRELRLGRHRRAAYIYAELLGDLLSAASALKQGRHFREAAVLLKDHLHRPLEAAECLAEAGATAEAVAIYEEKEHFSEAAALCARAGDLENAHRLFRLAVDERTRAGDLLAAANLLERSLDAPDEAAALLRSGWPGSEQAGKCLRALFDLHRRRGAHAATGALLTDLSRGATPPSRRRTLAETLTEVFAHYPDVGLRHRAADLARVSIAAGLEAAGEPEVKALLAILRGLAPEDRLLARDINRHLAVRREAERHRTLTAPAPPRRPASLTTGDGPAPRLRHTFRLPGGVHWRVAQSRGTHFLAAGIHEDGDPVLVRGGWDASRPSAAGGRVTRGADQSDHGVCTAASGPAP